MKRWKEKSWEEDDEQDDRAFLKLKKEIGKKCFHIVPRYWRQRKIIRRRSKKKSTWGGGVVIVLYNADGYNDDEYGGSVTGILRIMLIVVIYFSMICHKYNI